MQRKSTGTPKSKSTKKTDGTLMTLYCHNGGWRVSTSGIPDGSGRVFYSRVIAAAQGIITQSIVESTTTTTTTSSTTTTTSTTSTTTSITTTNTTTPSTTNTANNPEDVEGEGEGEDGEEGEQQSTNIIPDSDRAVTTFSSLFWAFFNEKKYMLPSQEDNDKCFMFELASIINRVIVVYDKPVLYLHGVRNRTTLKEESPEIYATKYKWEISPSFEFKSEKEVLEASSKLNPVKNEGFVICDSHFNRVKIKCPSYVQLSLLSAKDKQGLNILRFLSIMQKNEGSEFLAYFPQFSEEFKKIETRFNSLVTKTEELFKQLSSCTDQKAYAKKVQELPKVFAGCLHTMKKGNGMTTRKFYGQMPVKRLLALIEEYEKDSQQEKN